MDQRLGDAIETVKTEAARGTMYRGSALNGECSEALTEKNRCYRGYYCQRCDADFYGFLFPFEGSAATALRYLLWVLERKNAAGIP
jgi:hypothetical protein